MTQLEGSHSAAENIRQDSKVVMLAVGRLHPSRTTHFWCAHAAFCKIEAFASSARLRRGEERSSLQRLIHDLDLRAEVLLLGHLPIPQLHACYADSTLVVLTSRSEGMPLVLMEAMAHGKTVLAPAITGIPELVCDGETGFLYRTGSLEDFVFQVERISKLHSALGPIRERARQHVLEHFNREKNVTAFGEAFLRRLGRASGNNSYENPVLQQI